jgi:hypothetical protein
LFLSNVLAGAWYMPFLAGADPDAILARAEPQMLNAIYRSNRAKATRRVQAAPTAKLDKDEDRVLVAAEDESPRAIRLDPEQPWAAPPQANLEQIAAAAQRANLIPRP